MLGTGDNKLRASFRRVQFSDEQTVSATLEAFAFNNKSRMRYNTLTIRLTAPKTIHPTVLPPATSIQHAPALSSTSFAGPQ